MDGATLKTLTSHDNGTTLDLWSGDSFEIRLAENPTTGYRWQLPDWNQAVVKKTSDQFIPPGSVAPGAGGEHVWFFSASAPGRATLRLEYRRAWESGAPAQTYDVTVAVA